eukprot:s7276_g3.t1
MSREVKPRKWFSWLVRFRGLTEKNKEDELDAINIDTLNDPSRKSNYTSFDYSWTTELKLNQLACQLKGQKRLSIDDLKALGTVNVQGPNGALGRVSVTFFSR